MSIYICEKSILYERLGIVLLSQYRKKNEPIKHLLFFLAYLKLQPNLAYNNAKKYIFVDKSSHLRF